jgi:hypothetical protein
MNVTPVGHINSELGWLSWRQPGLSICIISDRDLIYSWAQKIIVGYDIVIVHTDDEHFVTWINRMAVYTEKSISTGCLKVQEWASAMNRLRSRGQMPSRNSLVNNTVDKPITSPTGTKEVTAFSIEPFMTGDGEQDTSISSIKGTTDPMAINIEPPLTDDVGQTDILDSMSNNQVQDDVDISTYLRSIPLSVENKRNASQLALTMLHTTSGVILSATPLKDWINLFVWEYNCQQKSVRMMITTGGTNLRYWLHIQYSNH